MFLPSRVDLRAILADAPQHSDDTVRRACRGLIADPETDLETVHRAEAMLKLLGDC